nr:unnamed protein product [Digitaria exilis]
MAVSELPEPTCSGSEARRANAGLACGGSSRLKMTQTTPPPWAPVTNSITRKTSPVAASSTTSRRPTTEGWPLAAACGLAEDGAEVGGVAGTLHGHRLARDAVPRLDHHASTPKLPSPSTSSFS